MTGKRSLSIARMRYSSPFTLHQERDQMTTLQSKTAWITGAGTGIGLAAAQALAAGGATVVMSGRRADVLQREADAIKKTGGKAESEALDVSNAASVRRVTDAILARHGKID